MESSSNRSSGKELSQEAAAPENAPAAIRFEALEPRVLLSGDVNPAAIAIDGQRRTVVGAAIQLPMILGDAQRCGECASTIG